MNEGLEIHKKEHRFAYIVFMIMMCGTNESFWLVFQTYVILLSSRPHKNLENGILIMTLILVSNRLMIKNLDETSCKLRNITSGEVYPNANDCNTYILIFKFQLPFFEAVNNLTNLHLTQKKKRRKEKCHKKSFWCG